MLRAIRRKRNLKAKELKLKRDKISKSLKKLRANFRDYKAKVQTKLLIMTRKIKSKPVTKSKFKHRLLETLMKAS